MEGLTIAKADSWGV